MATIYWPFPTSTVSEWPGQRPGSYHVGTDFAVPQGSTLRATIAGRVVRYDNDGSGAAVIDIIAPDGLLARHGHLSRMDVRTGDQVQAGDVIGLTGGQRGTPGAGNSTGPHLHWELRTDRAWSGGKWIDPRNLNPQPLRFGQAAPTTTKGQFMRVTTATDGKGYLVTDDGFYWLESMQIFNLFVRLINATTAAPDKFNPTEIAMMDDVLMKLRTGKARK